MNNYYCLVEGEIDGKILRSILDFNCDNKNINFIVAKGKDSMFPIVRVLRLMHDPTDKIIMVFDSNRIQEHESQELVDQIKFLTSADVSAIPIGVFCFTPSLPVALGLNAKLLSNHTKLAKHLKENIVDLKRNKTIVSIQAFIAK